MTYAKDRGHCGSGMVSLQIIHKGMTDSTCILAKDDVIQSTRGKNAKKYVYRKHMFQSKSTHMKYLFQTLNVFKKQTSQIKTDTLNKTVLWNGNW